MVRMTCTVLVAGLLAAPRILSAQDTASIEPVTLPATERHALYSASTESTYDKVESDNDALALRMTDLTPTRDVAIEERFGATFERSVRTGGAAAFLTALAQAA